MKRSALLIAALLVACASATPSPTAVPTDTPVPPTPTAIPLASVDLSGALIQDGDLPAGFSGAQLRDKAPAMFRDVPAADQTVYQEFEQGGRQAGGVAVFLFTDNALVDKAYEVVRGGMVNLRLLEGVGDRAEISDVFIVSSSVEVAFARCQAFIHIRMSNTDNTDAVAAYAKRLDKRLQALVCR